MAFRFTHDGLEVDGTIEPVWTGAFHYWRNAKDLWPGILDSIREMGFRMIETYIPWGVHETDDGSFDFGSKDPQKDLGAFIELCAQKDLRLIVRPGPHINAELNYFGFPQRILQDDAIAARGPAGEYCLFDQRPTQFPIPSYASEKLFCETEKWFDAIAPLLRKHSHPKGPICAIQIDNESCYFFRYAAYTLDYHPDSIRLYKRMLKEKYRSIANLNSSYGSTFKDFDSVEAPRGFTGGPYTKLPYFMDWAEYKEYQIRVALKRISRMWQDRGIRLPSFQNFDSNEGVFGSPYNLSALESSDTVQVAGIDAYINREESPRLRERAKFLAGSSLMPFIPEFGSGVWWTHQRTMTPDEERFSILYSLMHGVKAISFYMLVERDRWQGSPITRNGIKRKGYFDMFREMSAFIREKKALAYQKRPKILVLRPYEMSRFKAVVSLYDPNPIHGFRLPEGLTRSRESLGLTQLSPELGYRDDELFLSRSYQCLSALSFDYDIADTSNELSRIDEYSAVILPVWDFINKKVAERLLHFVNKGGCLFMGPGLPWLDEGFKPMRIFEEALGTGQAKDGDGAIPCGHGRIIRLSSADDLPKRLMAAGLQRELLSYNPKTEIVCQWAGLDLLAYVANPTAETQETLIRPAESPPKGFRERALKLAPYSVVVLEEKA